MSLEYERARVRRVMSAIDDDEDLARAVRMEMEERFGWSLAYFDESELRYRFASHHGYDEADEVPDDIWELVWPVLRNSRFWRDALWLDEYVGDTFSVWLSDEAHRSFPDELRQRIAAWEVV